jgi:spore coat protein CotH
VHQINLQFYFANYWDSLTIYYNQGNGRYIPAAATINGVVYDSVGVRFKGNSSYNHPNNKKPFKISLDEFKSGQRLDGMKNFVLNNCYADPTFMREKMHLDFCKDAGIPAPRANFANLSVNGSLFAFYSMVEQVDKILLNTRFGNNEGNLFKAVDAFGSSLISDLKWYGSSQSSYYSRYELNTNEVANNWSDLVSCLDVLNNSAQPLTSIPTKVNLQNFYRTLATDILFANLDAYVNSGRNFYFYSHPTTGKFEWIVWDVNMSFGSYSGGISNFETMSITYVSSTTNRPLINKIYNTPGLRTEYLQSLCYLYKSFFSSARLFPKIDAIANMIRPYVYADPKKQYTNQQFETNITSDITSGGRKPGLKSFITARQASVQTQLNSNGVSCILAANPGDIVINEFMADNTVIPDTLNQFDDWIEIYNNSNLSMNLGGMYLSDDLSFPTKWQFPPNTILDPDSYLVVWADEDSAQSGLHATFKLSASGERIILSNLDLTILDSITFGPQVSNLSMSRIPNGTGNFVQVQPTFLANNNTTTGTPAMTELVVPQYIGSKSAAGANNSRTLFAVCLQINGLIPNTTYDTQIGIGLVTDAATVYGAGNVWNKNRNAFTGQRDTASFTTNSNGESGPFWVYLQPTGNNARFNAGQIHNLRVGYTLSGGNFSSDPNFVGTKFFQALDIPVTERTANTTDDGAFIKGTGFGNYSGQYALIYNDVSGAGDPMSCYQIRNSAATNTTQSELPASINDIFLQSGTSAAGDFALVIPIGNNNEPGLRRVEIRNSQMEITGVFTDNDGIWSNGTNTTALVRRAVGIIDFNSFFGLTLNAFLEGMYDNDNNSMTPDTITVQLRSVSSPYNIEDVSKGILNSNGTGTFNYSNVTNGVPYYIVIKHRNSIETWSSAGVTFSSGQMSYNLTSSASQAFGNNMKQIDTSPLRFGIFTGDVNQDEFTDLADLVLISNNAALFALGYLPTDVNGDGITDLSDIVFTFNNASKFVTAIKP